MQFASCAAEDQLATFFPSYAATRPASPRRKGVTSMNKRTQLAALVVSLLSVCTCAAAAPAQKKTIAKPAVGDSSGAAAYAWFLFTQAMTPSNGLLTFETWTEQCQLNPTMAGCPPASKSGAHIRILHASALAKKIRGLAVKPTAISGNGTECNSMQTTALNG